MTLITGFICRVGGKKCILINADKAVTYLSRRWEEKKLYQFTPFPIIGGACGKITHIQKSERILSSFLNGIDGDSDKDLGNLVDDLLYSKKFRNSFINEVDINFDAEFLIGLSTTNDTKLYKLYSSGNVRELINFGSVGSGSSLGGIMVLNSVNLQDTYLSLNEAARLGGTINIFISLLTSGVSSDFSCLAICEGKIGKLKSVSKIRLLDDANKIVSTWSELMKTIFSLSPKAKLDFMLDSDIGMALKEFEKEKKKNERKKVLIIDDEYEMKEKVYNNIRKVLDKKSLEIIVYSSREKVKEGIKKIKNDILFIIMDYIINYKNTSDIADMLHKFVPGIPVILLSRGMEEKDFSLYLEKGVSLHIQKEDIEKSPKKFEENISVFLSDKDYLWDWNQVG